MIDDATPSQEDSSSDVDPILMNDQSDTKPGLPLLPPGNYSFKVVSIEQAPNSKGTGKLIKIQLGLMEEEEVCAVGGEPVHPGFPMFTNIPITPTPNYPKASIDKALKTFMLATGVPDESPGTGPFFPLTRYVGKVLPKECCKVKVSKERNEVRFVAPKKR
jgi:hypothetical protein